MRLLLSFPIAALAASLAAQVVSPVSSATAEGDGNNVFPFGQTTVRRYMQIHADLGPTPLVITKLAFRADAWPNGPYAGTRVHDIEVYMGEGLPTSQQLPNFIYDANYVFPKTTVLPRTFVTWGPQGATQPGPNPFNGSMEIVLAVPFVYTGALPLIWEVAYFGSVLTGAMAPYDADGSTSTTGLSTITGTGCAPTGSATLMTHTYTVNDTSGILMMNGTVAGAPANMPVLMAIGFTNPAVPVPGMCGNLYTDAVVLQFLGFASATGAYTADVPTGAILMPNAFTGVQLFTQALAFDPLSAFGIPFTMSNGRSATVPAPGLAQVNQITRLWNSAGGTTTPWAVFSTSTVGYGLVVEFTHL